MKTKESIETGNPEKLNFDLNELLKIGFKDFSIDLSESILNEDSVEKMEKVSIPKQKKFIISSSDFNFGDDFEIDISSSSENKVNQRRESVLREEFTSSLVNCLQEEDFEFGFKSKSEQMIKDQFTINALATRNWLNEIFIENFDNEKVIIGILRIIGRFEEKLIFPQGQTMALAALVHESNEIKELGIRAFENWGSINSLNVLKRINIDTNWLNDYLNQVIEDLTEDLCHY